MRLIDKDALRNTLEAWIERMNQRANATQYHTELVALNAEIEVIESAIDEIERMPTIEAEPIRESEWYITETSLGEVAVMCGRCKAMQDRMSPYCPECGARTDMYEMENADDET